MSIAPTHYDGDFARRYALPWSADADQLRAARDHLKAQGYMSPSRATEAVEEALKVDRGKARSVISTLVTRGDLIWGWDGRVYVE